MLQRALPGSSSPRYCARYRAPAPRWGGPRWVVRAEPEDKPDSNFESLFSKELQRRGLSAADEEAGSRESSSGRASSSGPAGAPTDSSGAAPGTNPFAPPSSAGSTTRTRPRAPPPPKVAADSREDGQRQKSMDLVTEGLEGLIPRATELLRLGGGAFLAFLPFMLAFSLLFTGIFFVFGDNFLHGGRPDSGPPPYIDPERLLSEPTVDPYIPYNTNPYSSPDLR